MIGSAARRLFGRTLRTRTSISLVSNAIPDGGKLQARSLASRARRASFLGRAAPSHHATCPRWTSMLRTRPSGELPDKTILLVSGFVRHLPHQLFGVLRPDTRGECMEPGGAVPAVPRLRGYKARHRDGRPGHISRLSYSAVSLQNGCCYDKLLQ